MRILVTGAAGFLGRAVLNAARTAGHDVLALHRRCAPLPAGTDLKGLTPVAGDLRQMGHWTAAAERAEAVIHCAAAASGDLPTQLAGTVLATENLLAALPRTLARFVHVSSFSVYDFGAPSRFGALDESTAIEPRPLRRDAYTQTKLMQETMVRTHCRDAGIPLVVLRPGAIYGPGKDWGYGSALRLGPFDLVFAPFSRMRLVHVDDCARAIVAALDAQIEREAIVNVVGDAQPSHWGFHRRARKAGADAGIAIPVPYAVVRALGGAARLASKAFFGGRARLPEWLDLPRQEARWRPLRYANAKAKAVLGWQETRPFESRLERMLAEGTKDGA